MIMIVRTMQSLEEQFLQISLNEHYKITHYYSFKFNNNVAEPHIRVIAPSEHSQCVIGMNPRDGEVKMITVLYICTMDA